MTSTLSVDDLITGDFVLSVTSRNTEDTTPQMLEELTYKTIKAWLWIVQNYLEKQTYALPENMGSVEQRYADELTRIQLADSDQPPKEPFKFQETFGDARVTVWDTFKSSNRIGFHLNSDDIPQLAVDTWYANHNAVKRVKAEYTAPAAPKNAAPPATAPSAPQTQQAPPVATEGIIAATRAPSKNRQYADGQVLQFNINKIVKGTNKGSVTYNLWGDLGKNYALKTVYMTKSGSDEKSVDYLASRDILEGLNLSVDAGKIEAHGDWKLVTKVAHGKNGKGEETEFFNILSLAAI